MVGNEQLSRAEWIETTPSHKRGRFVLRNDVTIRVGIRVSKTTNMTRFGRYMFCVEKWESDCRKVISGIFSTLRNEICRRVEKSILSDFESAIGCSAVQWTDGWTDCDWREDQIMLI